MSLDAVSCNSYHLQQKTELRSPELLPFSASEARLPVRRRLDREPLRGLLARGESSEQREEERQDCLTPVDPPARGWKVSCAVASGIHAWLRPSLRDLGGDGGTRGAILVPGVDALLVAGMGSRGGDLGPGRTALMKVVLYSCTNEKSS